MTHKRRLIAGGVGALVIGLGLLGGWAWATRPRELPPLANRSRGGEERTERSDDQRGEVVEVLPEFEEPSDELPRAPAHELFGVSIGEVMLEDLLEELRGRGLECDDTGIRASMEKLRAHKRKQLAEADDPDAVTGASILHRRSKKERNPQIRLACELDSLAELDPDRAHVSGRSLFVFDSPEHPLRHASLRRTYRISEAAMLDVRESVARFEAIYGEPTSRRGIIPLPGDAPAKPEPIRVQWRYADLLVEVSSTSFGKLVSVDERVEVPWPIRADALR